MKLFGKVLIILAAVWLIIFSFGKEFDKICIEGRLSAAQAEAVSQMDWGKCPKYNNGECQAVERDRIFKGECSEFFRTLFFR